MSDDKTEWIIKDLTKRYIDEPLAMEELIRETAKQAAAQLLYAPDRTARFEFLNEEYIAKSQEYLEHGKLSVRLVISNETHRKSAKRYIPFTATGTVDNRFDLSENTRAILETFFRHITGTVQPEVIDDE